VFVFRCTKRLYQRIEPWAAPEREPLTQSTTRLGDWTANIVIIRRQQLVLAVSNVTLLPVLLPIAPAKTLLIRFPEAVAQVLRALRIDPEKVATEVNAMGEVIVTSAKDRKVLGSLNDFVRMLDAYLDERSLTDVALELAEAPCGPLGMKSPREATLALFVTPGLRLVRN
jgi:hypothetical protein